MYHLQPMAVLPNVIASRMVVSGWGDFTYGIVLFVISQSITVAGVALFFLFSVLTCMVFTAIRVIYHSFTFFLGNAEDFANVASEFTLTFSL